MTGVTAFERLLRRDRAIVAAGLAALCALAWAYVLSGAGLGMDVRQLTTLALFPHKAAPAGGMDMAAGAPWTARVWLLTLGMWAAMMVAMMTPSAAPAILLYGRIRARAEASGGRGGVAPTAAFAGGYLAVWLAFSLLAAALSWTLARSGLISPAALGSQSRWLSALVLAAAGAYQLSPLKDACLGQCRTPTQFLTRHWRPGVLGAVRLGALHGAYCVGCCWILMGLLFVGGVMNLAWIAALTLLIVAEKLVPTGPSVARATGLTLIVWALATAVV
jgi:predicted metal-binding membrane protein